MEGRCGADTNSGTKCKTKVQSGQRCWIHRSPQCAVCFASMPAATRTLDCGHTFHSRCVERWKRTCPGDPTCPMCRVPFDLPVYKCRLIIERTHDGQRTVSDFETSNISSIMDGFGIDLRGDGRAMQLTDIRFDINPGEILNEILTELGLPLPNLN